MLTRLARWWLKSGTVNPQPWLSEWLQGSGKSSSGVVVTSAKALQDIVTMACVTIRSQDLAKLPVHVYRSRRDGGKEVIADHPLERLLRKPNAWQTRFEFLEQMQIAYLLSGNAFAPVLRDERGAPRALVPVPPENVCMYAAADSLFYEVKPANDFAAAVLASLPPRIASDDVLHLRWATTNGLIGLSRTHLARNAIGLSLALEEHSATLFASGARPGGVLETDKKLGDEAFMRLKSQWSDSYGGSANAGKTALLEEGLKWKPQTMTSVESQTVEARRAQFEQIATAFDVPLHRLGIIPDGGSKDMLIAHQMYLNNVLSSDAERWESKLNDLFELDGESEFVEFNLDYFNRADLKTRLDALRVGIVGSLISVNEGRRQLGLPDDPGGDVIFQPANVVPLGTELATGPGPGSDVTGEPAAGGSGDPAAIDPIEE